ncbi:MAG: uroporphyrinogen decarboxylase [Ignavibacteriaceae bacterium]|nr:uroporphyrinogen decarboxylase [Ignavibacteriaceae bacterium]
MKQFKNDLFLRACKREATERTPIWVMRQAGRYLPQYMAVREKSDFLTMCRTPELACEVTVQPVDLIGVDAAIIFSDILIIPEAMGLELIMNEGVGPKFTNPIKDVSDISRLKYISAVEDLKYVLDAVKLTAKTLDSRVPLIGFTGAPWTLMTYMVEGGGSKSFSKIKKFIYSQPEAAHLLLERITDAVCDYINAKIDAGVDAVQIFDTWASLLSPKDFTTFSLPYIKKIVKSVNSRVPVIVFAKGAHFAIEEIINTGTDVIGLDWTMDLAKTKGLVNGRTALQGNLDPTVLYAPDNYIKAEAERVLSEFGKGNGHIFNLGHGIHPDTEPAKLKLLVDYIKENSGKYHTT